jgi:hypothetical protein
MRVRVPSGNIEAIPCPSLGLRFYRAESDRLSNSTAEFRTINPEVQVRLLRPDAISCPKSFQSESKVNVYLNGTKVATVGRPTQASS